MADDETKSRCLKAYKSGVPVNDLANRFGVTRKTIRRWLDSMDEKSKSGEKSEIEKSRPLKKIWGGRWRSPVYPVNDPSWGRALSAILEEKGISSEELSKMCGVSSSTIRKIASGSQMGNIATWSAFARSLGMTIGEIEEDANGR